MSYVTEILCVNLPTNVVKHRNCSLRNYQREVRKNKRRLIWLTNPKVAEAANWNGYNCYKVIAKDFDLRKPWKKGAQLVKQVIPY